MNPEPARKLPILRLAVLCEDVEEDGTERPAIIRFPVHTLRFPPGTSRNYRPPVLTLYVQLQGDLGLFFFRVVLRLVGGAREVTIAHFDDDLDAADEVFPLERTIALNRLVFPAPDVYELLVYANAANLHEPNDHIQIPFPPIRVAVLPADGTAGGAV
ncbi:hypothetical protein J8F10_25140 [Gemmata sp. G18]|uniref:Wzt C-terminal domain-containing protein n=1 Tax=Gemmata palustris TaxID=2822762 RepID=A0ABS5BY11_9BACT|nr:hypothetical protein [Gemmata palustris]MBP3958548.1 hypothetical protein [Gemmata palustris]